MGEPLVRQIGYVECLEGGRVYVGVDYDSVTLRGAGHLSRHQREALAQLLVRADWEAGRNAAQMAEMDAGALDP